MIGAGPFRRLNPLLSWHSSADARPVHRRTRSVPRGAAVVPGPAVIPLGFCHGREARVVTVAGETVSWCWACGFQLRDLREV
jgi:hypothetical protein